MTFFNTDTLMTMKLCKALILKIQDIRPNQGKKA